MAIRSPCAPALTALSRRLAVLAKRDARVICVDAKDVIDPADLSLYDPDLTHPSRADAALIGDLIAHRMAQVSPG
ncbi:hypothetical protein [Loktanella sp. M215]|uniref:hypothetical protein n=1 Tax=Loktanella sp. M215 TaxID=2675431 RepID=UPI001F25E75C|nr:hypothetical protein [Loktanella sp. M215]MCF7701303.1 hypothetical protein [Loktanella sp. M215]